jgi:hypothetical protein
MRAIRDRARFQLFGNQSEVGDKQFRIEKSLQELKWCDLCYVNLYDNLTDSAKIRATIQSGHGTLNIGELPIGSIRRIWFELET